MLLYIELKVQALLVTVITEITNSQPRNYIVDTTEKVIDLTKEDRHFGWKKGFIKRKCGGAIGEM